MSNRRLELLDGLEIKPTSCVAFVGAGGKTSAIFTLVKEFQERIFISTTTHFSIDQLSYSKNQWIVDSSENLKSIDFTLPGSHIFVSSKVENERVKGASLEILDRLQRRTKSSHVPLLIEADGARRLPLKTPAEHEPVIPGWVDTVVVCCGLSALGKPLTDEFVHRSDLAAELVKKNKGDLIEMQDLVTILTNENGGIKSIPENARRILILNQTDSLADLDQVKKLISELLKTYSVVILCSLKNHKINFIYKRSSGVILAAGESRRFGRNKLKELWRGKPLVRHVAENALASNLFNTTVVVGHDHEAIMEILEDLNVDCIMNSDWQEGQGTSVKIAITKIKHKTDGVVFLLGDQPQINRALINKLLEEHARTLSPIIAPYYHKKRGNPVLFDKSLFDALVKISGDRGGKTLFDRFPITKLDWDNPNILLDIDFPEDLTKLG